MVENSASLPDEGFNQENRERIYRGLPALSHDKEPAEILTEDQFAVLRSVAHGLRVGEIAEQRDTSPVAVYKLFGRGYGRLGIVDRHQIAGYFPLDPEHVLLQDVSLTDLGVGRLDTLQGLSVGLSHDQLAADPNSKYMIATRRKHTRSISSVWPDVGSAVTGIVVANALRASYIDAIEGPTLAVPCENLDKLSLPELGKIEPVIVRAIEARTALEEVGIHNSP